MRKRHPRTTLKSSRSRTARRVKELAKSGLTEDEIVLRVGATDKNQLRRRHIDSLKQGRAEARAASDAAADEELSVDEATMRRSLFAGYGSPRWDGPAGNLLQNSRTLAETEALWREWLRRSRAGQRTLPVNLPGYFPER